MNILLMLAFFLFLITLILMFLCMMLSKKSVNWREKFIPFECGFDFFTYSRVPFSMRFFLIAIIFIIFDVEIALILPLISMIFKANVLKWTMTSFIFFLILFFGILYEWKEQSFDWKF